MDERRFRTALDVAEAVIRDYDEPTIVAAFGVILDRLGYVVAERDPGPADDEEEVWAKEVDGERVTFRLVEGHKQDWVDSLSPAARGALIDLTGRWR